MYFGTEFEESDETTIELRSGGRLPLLGLGTWNASFAPFSDLYVEGAVISAIRGGYRLIDCAQTYFNEKEIGRGIQKCLKTDNVRREDLFIVSKLPPKGNRPGGVKKHLNQTLKDLQLDYLDLYLIETPWSFEEVGEKLIPINEDGKVLLDMNTNNTATWEEMEKQVDLGKVRAIGLSNFNYSQVMEIHKVARIPISVIQMEMHVYFQSSELDKYRDLGIKVMACCPLGSPALALMTSIPEEFSNPLSDPIIKKIAIKYGRTPAQVLLKFLIQKGVSVIPKSYNTDRMSENYYTLLCDLKLDDLDIKELEALDNGAKGRVLDFVSFYRGVEKHPKFPFNIETKDDTKEATKEKFEEGYKFYM